MTKAQKDQAPLRHSVTKNYLRARAAIGAKSVLQLVEYAAFQQTTFCQRIIDWTMRSTQAPLSSVGCFCESKASDPAVKLKAPLRSFAAKDCYVLR